MLVRSPLCSESVDLARLSFVTCQCADFPRTVNVYRAHKTAPAALTRNSNSSWYERPRDWSSPFKTSLSRPPTTISTRRITRAPPPSHTKRRRQVRWRLLTTLTTVASTNIQPIRRTKRLLSKVCGSHCFPYTRIRAWFIGVPKVLDGPPFS